METSRPNFYIQWHITDRCSQRCKYCYLFQDKNYSTGQKNELSLRKLSLIAEDMFKTSEVLRANAVFVLTGGDPILHPQFWNLLKVINDLSDKFNVNNAIDILGNPFYIDLSTALKLKRHGVRKYQLSLDGLEEKHDYLRMPGSYKETLKAVHILKEASIRPTCMFTLSKFNASDLIGIMRETAKHRFDAFAFARFCRPSNWSMEEYRKQMFTPFEYRQLLEKVNNARIELSKIYPETRFVFKDHLWELFFYERCTMGERKEIEEIKKQEIVVGGCSLGIASLSVLSDGTVYACRRFESPIGKVPDQSLIELFIDSPKLNDYRDLAQHKKCNNCPLLYVCRGCGAVTYGASGDFFNPDPQCWF